MIQEKSKSTLDYMGSLFSDAPKEHACRITPCNSLTGSLMEVPVGQVESPLMGMGADMVRSSPYIVPMAPTWGGEEGRV